MPNPSPSPVITIAVASDLHASAVPGDAAPSHCRIGLVNETALNHPVPGLMKLIEKLALRADILLCPGDLADRAEPGAVRYAWRVIHDLGAALQSRHIMATAGNHDVDSRHQYNKFDAKGVLQSLTPRFPVPDESSCDQFWSRHFTIVREDNWQVVVLNSSAFHGTTDVEYEHGRISDYTLDALRTALDGAPTRDLNILLCHHHPHPHSELGLGEQDLMKGGQLLLDMLGCGRYGQWMVIHGHKHHPKLSYASGATASSPVVFAAGSLSAVLYRELQTQARNQFYLLEFNISDIRTHGLVGRYRSWDWAMNEGWVPSRRGSGLPSCGGFGNRLPHSVVAAGVAKLAVQPSVKWDDICGGYPTARYLLPHDELLLEEALRRVHQRSLLRGSDGQIERVEAMQ